MSRRSRILSVSEAEFQALVQEALDSVPEPYAQHLANVAVVVEEEPSQEVLDELERRDLATALVTLCVGAGMGTATVIERI